MLENVEALLAEAGASAADLAQMIVYLAGPGRLSGRAEKYSSCATKRFPGCSCSAGLPSRLADRNGMHRRPRGRKSRLRAALTPTGLVSSERQRRSGGPLRTADRHGSLSGRRYFRRKDRRQRIAARHIYRTGWFAAWWALIAASALPVAVVRIGPGKRAAVALHLSLGLILFGALLTFATSQKGYVHLRERTKTACFRPETGGEARPLPFSLRLERFEIECYPGTQAPADYRSLLTVVDSRGPRQAVVSMNRILSCDGYRLYQTSFDEDMRGSILSVNRTPTALRSHMRAICCSASR